MARERAINQNSWKTRKVVGGLVGLLLLLAVLPAPANAYPRPGLTERVSVASDGTEGSGPSSDTEISADGRYVAFASLAPNLVPGDTNGKEDIFVHDRDTGTTERVSVTSDGREGNGLSQRPTISADGRYVVFWSEAANLVTGDTNGRQDVFVHDRDTGNTERVSVASDGKEANGHSFNFSISADGRYVAYESLASNLVSGDTNLTSDVFVRDRDAGTTERVSVANDGTQGNNHSIAPSISADGRHVAFLSLAPLLPGDGNGAYDVFVRDRDTGTTERVSVSSHGTTGNTHSFFPSISADGRHVAFYGGSSNLVPGDRNGEFDVFVRDREAGTTERVSVTSDGVEGDALSQGPAISADGRHVAFWSSSPILVPGDTNGKVDVFVHDRDTRTTERVSVASDGTEGNNVSRTPSISADGRFVAFYSFAANLVPGITNGASDVFVHDRGPAIGVGALEVQQGPDELLVSGWATFSGAAVASDEDPEDDGGAAAHDVGAELTGAALIYRPEREDLLLRLDLSSLPSDPAAAGRPGILYGADLRIGGTRYEVRAFRAAAIRVLPRAPHVALYRCAPNCTEHALLTGSFGSTGEQVLVSVPLSRLAAAEGTELTDLRGFTAVGDSVPGAIQTLDEVPLSTSSVIPASRVELGIAPASTPEEEVTFTVTADLVAGDFSGTISTDGLSPGSYRVWSQACLGNACGPAAAAPVTLGDGISPSPSPSTTSTESPTPTPTESPVPETTTVGFTERSAESGQYSDESLFEARLTDSNGDPISTKELTFELTGAESSRSFTATTNDDGIASVTPVLEEKPGPYRLTVRYEGSEDLAPSADVSGFVVEKEDTSTELEVQGKGKNRMLIARLSDPDSPQQGIAGRTITFYGDGQLIGTASTGNDGAAALEPPPQYRGGNYIFEARFEGDAFYVHSSDRRQ